MALAKRVKVGGGYYRGYNLSVLSASAEYVLYIENTSGAAINGISITPDEYGALDHWRLEHYSKSSGGGDLLAIIAETVYNVGKNATIMLDFPAMEIVNSGESLKFVYVNTASVAMTVYLTAEFVGMRKTA